MGQKFLTNLLLLISIHAYPAQSPDKTIKVYFETGKFVMDHSEEQKLESFFAKNAGISSLRIAGHTDTVGSAPSNMLLSRKRSEYVGKWLKKHFNTANITMEHFGETQICCPDNNRLNRRVEITIRFAPSMADAGKANDTLLIKRIQLDKLYFRPDKAILENYSLDYLSTIIPVLKGYRDAHFEIRGHVNYETTRHDSGEIKKMNELSVARAKLIYEMLMDKGIPAEQMTYRGMGNTQMAFPHPANEEEKRKNMRVEILVFGNK